jgi:serine/threonine protein kinase
MVVCTNCQSAMKDGDTFCSECGAKVVSVTESRRDPLIGRTLAGGYRIVEFIAEGSMGRVYRGEQSNLGRSVAIKMMSAGLAANPAMVERFKNEARAASALNHPNCVRVYDFGQTPDGAPYFVMELLTGTDLEGILTREPLQPVTRVLDLMLQILSALDEAHGLSVVHRDLKPANIVVLPQRGGGDLVKVVDFGLAKLRQNLSAPDGSVFGTPEYIAPEQAMARDTDGRTDLYACGVILFEMVTGRLPFYDEDPQRLMEKHVVESPPDPAELAKDRVHYGLGSIILKALEKSPEARFQSASDFAEALREVVAHRTGERTTSDTRSWVRATLRPCQECGGLNGPSSKFCGECGSPVERESLATRPPRPAVEAATPDTRSMSARHSIDTAIADAEAGGDTPSALVFLEQIAVARLKAGDPHGAITALRRGIDLARKDLDVGSLDDPIHVVGLFSIKLGEAYIEVKDYPGAQRTLKDALSLSRPGRERAKVWALMARLAEHQGHSEDAATYRSAETTELEQRPRSSARNTSVR